MADDPAYRAFQVGRFTYGRPLVMGEGEASLSVGSFCSIGDGTRIMLGGNHRVDWVTTYPFCAISAFSEFSKMTGHPKSKGPVVIGSDVWIGQDALILSGVTIGNGAVIGARSVVASDVPPYAIAVGNPARVIRKRFEDGVIASLLEIEWWNWPLARIKEAMPLLLSGDVARFIETAKGAGNS